MRTKAQRGAAEKPAIDIFTAGVRVELGSRAAIHVFAAWIGVELSSGIELILGALISARLRGEWARPNDHRVQASDRASRQTTSHRSRVPGFSFF